ncbi:hypothetical protein MTR67_023810 [Solanum verrucosum]|uniref:Uncharacterized protein n=1 Tax=Solanum verrucosum TaxID=315347 RepID=A0AAF0QX92_SOLVR|nr:hypothetical protein MTR67_023810 [Solanum verrucosum]
MVHSAGSWFTTATLPQNLPENHLRVGLR